MFNSNPNNQYISNKKISIFPRAQANYGRGGTGKNNLIRFNIPQYHGYILPDQSYLKFNYTQDEGGIGQCQPDPRCGFHSLFSTVRTSSGDGMAMIEEVDDYNSLQSSLFQYTKNDSIENKRQLYEGVSPTPYGATFSLFNEQPPPINTTQTASLAKKKVEAYMPINTGALSLNSTILPVVALNGVDIELQLDNVRRSLVYTMGSKGFAERAGTSPDPDNGQDLTRAVTAGDGSVYFKTDDNYPSQPFDVGDQLLDEIGQVVGTIGSIATSSTSNLEIGTIAPVVKTVVDYQALAEAVIGSSTVTIEKMNPTDAPRIPDFGSFHNNTWCQGLTATVTPSVGSPFTFIIGACEGEVLTTSVPLVDLIGVGDAISIAAIPNYTIELSTPAPSLALGASISNDSVAYFNNPAVNALLVDDWYIDGSGDQQVELKGVITTEIPDSTVFTTPALVAEFQAILLNPTTVNIALPGKIWFDNAVREPTIGYTMSNVQLVCTVVTPPEEYVTRMMAQIQTGNGLNLDIKTFSTYRNNVIDNNGVTTQLIPAISKRAYSILSLPLNNTIQRTLEESAFTPYITGQQQYQYIHSNMLIPDREVAINERLGVAPNYRNHGFSAVYTNEIDKALTNCGYTVRNLRNQRDFFMIGREFSKQGQVYNLHDGDLSLRIFYIGADDPRLFLHYICHLQRVNVNKMGISVVS